MERLTAAALVAHAPDNAASRRVASLPDATRAEFAACGLVPPRGSDTPGPFLPAHVASRGNDAEPTAVRRLREAAGRPTGFPGEGKPPRAVTAGDAGEFRRHLVAENLGPDTVARRTGRADQFSRGGACGGGWSIATCPRAGRRRCGPTRTGLSS